MIDRESTDLPEPDSPTIPSVLPRSIDKLTPLTAPTLPRGLENVVESWETSNNGPVPGA